jgi:hypothetical protein
MLTSDQWQLAKDMVICLAPVQQLTVALQNRTHVLISMFLSLLNECTLALSKLSWDPKRPRALGDITSAGREFAAALLGNIEKVSHNAAPPVWTHTALFKFLQFVTLGAIVGAVSLQRFKGHRQGNVEEMAVAMLCDPRTIFLEDVEEEHHGTFAGHFDRAMLKVIKPVAPAPSPRFHSPVQAIASGTNVPSGL